MNLTRVRTVRAGVTAAYRRASSTERACYRLAGLLALSGLAHVGVQLALGGPWTGPVSWRKPVDFGLAFAVTLASVVWASRPTSLRPITRDRALRVFAVASAVEVAAISVQAWRKVPSHFNTTTPLNATFAYAAAAGGAAILVSAAVLTFGVLRRPAQVDQSRLLAARTGFVSLMVALSIGAVMIGLGTRVARSGSLRGAYDAALVLVPAHGVAMQGVALLPALAWLATLTHWPAERRWRTVACACLCYCVSAASVIALAGLGSSPPRWATWPLTTLALAGALACLTALGAVLAALPRHQPHSNRDLPQRRRRPV